jgi:hypothetical protein
LYLKGAKDSMFTTTRVIHFTAGYRQREMAMISENKGHCKTHPGGKMLMILNRRHNA